MLRNVLIFLCLCLQSALACAQEAAAEREISVDGSVYYYFLPDEDDLATPVLSLSWGALYLEGRYNYESRDSGSIWLGTPFSFGNEIEFEITPMIGGIMGSIHGMAPGVELDATWKRLNLYSEAEYVFDFDSREENYFYSWSELTFAILEHFKIGIAASRTRAYDSAVELDRGPLAVLEMEHLSFSAAVLNVDTDPITIISASLSF